MTQSADRGPAIRAVFYAERDQRTSQYAGDLTFVERPVVMVVGRHAAESHAGQVAALALNNMLVRVHRRVTVVAPAAVPLMAQALSSSTELCAALAADAHLINPVIDFTLIDADSANADLSETSAAPWAESSVTVGVGPGAPSGLSIYLDWDGGRGEVRTLPTEPAVDRRDDVVGAATAACLGAAAVFVAAQDRPVRPGAVNLVEMAAGDECGTTSIFGPIDVGRVLVLGAGAVTNAFLYWTRELGREGPWAVVDGDVAELSNTNRCLLMTAADAGWPDGMPSGSAERKATVAARAVGVEEHSVWYDDYVAAHPERPDLLLVLANERAVRPLVSTRGEPLLLHATTSSRWTAELHRHLADRDDCPACRLPDDASATFACSSGPADPASAERSDAALPFLSAAAGLMLTIALLDLPSAGRRFTEPENHWVLFMDQKEPLLDINVFERKCPHVLPAEVRAEVQAQEPRRWDFLDSDASER